MDHKKVANYFRYLFEDQEGLLCISTRNARTGRFRDVFFSYPEAVDEAGAACLKWALSEEVYFCSQLLRDEKRRKDLVLPCKFIWADLDTCPISSLRLPPTAVVHTSQGRTQAVWKLTEFVSPEEAEEVAKRIAYAHAFEGADKSGWDLTQLLRVPFTKNHKYARDAGSWLIRLEADPDNKYSLEQLLSTYESIEGHQSVPIPELPENLSEDARDVLNRVAGTINPRVWSLFSNEPTSDWSKHLWQLNLLLADAGLTKEEAFIVAKEAACNKYQRDHKPDKFLWADVNRAYAHHESANAHEAEPVYDDQIIINLPVLLSEAERVWCQNEPTFVEKYVKWAKSQGDAAWQYHQAGAFVMLSAVLSGKVKLPTSFGMLVPNLWFMILADTTLTRKSTAMDMAMDLLYEVDDNSMLATDGSIEGLLSAMALRTNRPSIFLRDEVSGLIEAMTKRDYYAGMLETLTKLYDGRTQKRILRKETIEVKDPILIFFAGGIKERLMQLLNFDHVNSGFLPRFIFITADSDISRLKPLGPPTQPSIEDRTELVRILVKMRDYYNNLDIPRGDKQHIHLPVAWYAELTPEAWIRYNKYEAQLLEAGVSSNLSSVITPVLDRTAKSGLKIAVLLAASRCEEKVVVDEFDLIRAFYYIEQWLPFALEVIANIGRSGDEQLLNKLLNFIKGKPGTSRSLLMQRFHLTTRTAEMLFSTLEQRGQVIRQKSGRVERFFPVSEDAVPSGRYSGN